MNLSPLFPEQFEELKPYFSSQSYRLCIYSLSSLLIWRNEKFEPYAVQRDGAVIIGFEFSRNRENRHLILPIAPQRFFTPCELYEIARELGFDSYHFVPEDYLTQFQREEISNYFNIREETEFEDYIYLKNDMAALAGNRFSKKRNLIKQFERQYLNENRVDIEMITPQTAPDCIDFIEKWCVERNCSEDPVGELACERIAAINAIENLEQVAMKGLLIRLDGVVSALGISSRLTDDIGVLHFEKALTTVKGLYQFLDRECARGLFDEYTYINKESDMGIPGLAQAKQSYFPFMRVKSFHLKIHPECKST